MGNDKLSQADQIVTCNPDVESAEVEPDWDFLLLACDGIWDVLSNQEVVDFVTQRIGQAMEPEDICEELMTRCLSPDCQMGGLGCDNMTCVLVCLLQGKPYQALVERCARQAAARVEVRGRLATGTRQMRLRRRRMRRRLMRRRAGRRGGVTESMMNWQAPDLNIAGF